MLESEFITSHLEEDLGLSHLPVIVPAEDDLCDPLAGSPQIFLADAHAHMRVLLAHIPVQH